MLFQRWTMQRPVRRVFTAVGLMLALGAGPCSFAGADFAPTSQALLGLPDSASTSPSNRDHYLIQRIQYALSYNNTLRFPNWVAWHLNASDVGSTSRGVFAPDTTLPSGFTVVTPNDYTRSGYDRGHNCPSADRSNSRQNNDAVFLMTNMTPQAHGMNAGPWEQLESYCRDLTKQGNELYILCGHGFSAPTHQTIGKAGIAVPDFGWKVVVVISDQPGNDAGRITPQTRVIAVKMPNVNTVSKQAWSRYIVTAGEVEQATGLQFFRALPSATAQALRQKRDAGAAGSSFTGVAGYSAGKRGHKEASSSFGKIKSSFGKLFGGKKDQVWVNTRSGAYWKPGTQYYGKTKEGKYMSEKDALKAGYHPEGKK